MNAHEKRYEVVLENRRRLALDWWYYSDALKKWQAENTMPESLEAFEFSISSNGLGWALLAVSEKPEESDDPMLYSALSHLETKDQNQMRKDEALAKIDAAMKGLEAYQRRGKS